MRWAIVLLAIGSVLVAGLLAPPAGAAGTGTPTHITLVSPTSVRVGLDVTLMGVLHNATSNEAVPGATLAFYARATFGTCASRTSTGPRDACGLLVKGAAKPGSRFPRMPARPSSSTWSTFAQPSLTTTCS